MYACRLTVLLFLLQLAQSRAAAGHDSCSPERRCTNSPQQGLSESSEFLVEEGWSAQEVAWFHAGMQYAIEGTRRCQFGHVDLEGSDNATASVRLCAGRGLCGWSIATHPCTCVSQERAMAGERAGRLGFLIVGVMCLVLGLAVGALFCSNADLPPHSDAPPFSQWCTPSLQVRSSASTTPARSA